MFGNWQQAEDQSEPSLECLFPLSYEDYLGNYAICFLATWDPQTYTNLKSNSTTFLEFSEILKQN